MRDPRSVTKASTGISPMAAVSAGETSRATTTAGSVSERVGSVPASARTSRSHTNTTSCLRSWMYASSLWPLPNRRVTSSEAETTAHSAQRRSLRMSRSTFSCKNGSPSIAR